MKTNKIYSALSSSSSLFWTFVVIFAATGSLRAGFLYVLNENNIANQIYGYRVNENNGALTLLEGFPKPSGGVGISNVLTTEKMTLDLVNRRLFVINDGSETVTAFSVDAVTGALNPLPFSPITLPSAGQWYSIRVHPSGSPLMVGKSDVASPEIHSYNLTLTTATPAQGSPFSTGGIRTNSTIFSRYGDYFYLAGGASNTFIAGYSVNPATGVLTALPNSPYDSGGAIPVAFATDSQGRLFTSNNMLVTARVFTTENGVLNAVTGNPFNSNIATAGQGALHPNEKFYYVADRSIGRVGLMQISGTGAQTTLTNIPVSSDTGSVSANGLAFNNNGNFLFATNANSRNIANFRVNPISGVPTFITVQPNNALGTSGLLNGVAYLPTFTAPFDFDGDNKTDVGIFRASDGSWWYSRSVDNAFRVFSFGASGDKVVPGDYSGDGKTDIAVFRSSSGEWFIQRSEDNSFYSYPFGASGDIPTPGDFDGDGKFDSAVFRPSEGTWYIRRSSDLGVSIVGFGTAEDKPVPADYDGDGKNDVAIFRPSDGSWWYLRSSDLQFRVFRFGLSTDKPVQGDYSGDGKADIAVFRPTTGEWFFQRSEDDSYYSVPFGANGDLPIPGDYDGDGKFDTAVFRPATANWFVQRSTAGILITSFGIAGDQPVPNAFVP